MSEWSDTWDYEGKTFIRCKKCGKAMPIEYKEKHTCGSENKEFKKANTVKQTAKDVLAKSIRDAVEITKDYDFAKEDIRAFAITLFLHRMKG